MLYRLQELQLRGSNSMTEFEGVATCTCPKCEHEFEAEVTIDVEPMEDDSHA